MHLKFSLNERSRRFVARLRLPSRFQGPPGHAHGGIIATVLDEAMGKVNRLRSLVALTSEMQVEYLKPVPLGKPLIVEGWEIRKRGRRLTHAAELRNPQGQVLARSRGTFVIIDPEKMFARYVRGNRRRYAPTGTTVPAREPKRAAASSLPIRIDSRTSTSKSSRRLR